MRNPLRLDNQPKQDLYSVTDYPLKMGKICSKKKNDMYTYSQLRKREWLLVMMNPKGRPRNEKSLEDYETWTDCTIENT